MTENQRPREGAGQEIPPHIVEMFDEHRRQLTESMEREAEFQREMLPTPEESQQREELLRRIYEKLGILPEMEELLRLGEAQADRMRAASDRYYASRQPRTRDDRTRGE